MVLCCLYIWFVFAYAVGRGWSWLLVVVGVVLTVFAVGYVVMAREVGNAGSLYTFVAKGLGRPAGIGAALVALVAYNALSFSLFGLIGAAVGPLLTGWFGVTPSWWVIALACWLLVAVLGVARVDVNGRVLAVLLVAEIAVIVVYSVSNLAHPAGGRVTAAALEPHALAGPGLGALLALAVLGFVGFETATVFSEESKDPRRTVRTATYIAIGCIAALYGLSSWAVTVAVGPAAVVAAARVQQAELVFNLAAGQLGQTLATIGRVLLATSVLAAMIAFHNCIARYAFALGRERVLPAWFGRTNRAEAPGNASVVQSVCALAVVVAYAAGGADPLLDLFYVLSAVGGFGVLLLITATSLSVVVFFGRVTAGERWWRERLAPVVATVALAAVVWLAVDNMALLLGVAEEAPLRWGVPAGYAVAVLAGIGWAVLLRARRPGVYTAIGLGARAALVGTGPGPVSTNRYPHGVVR